MKYKYKKDKKFKYYLIITNYMKKVFWYESVEIPEYMRALYRRIEPLTDEQIVRRIDSVMKSQDFDGFTNPEGLDRKNLQEMLGLLELATCRLL